MLTNPSMRIAGVATRRLRTATGVAIALACGLPTAAVAQDGDIKAEMLRVHNAERAAVGVQPLEWSQDLADEAREYGEKLAQTSGLKHDDAPESLYRGPANASYAQVAEAWASEKAIYHNEEFQTGSKTISTKPGGSWFDIGHYTQMVWRGTTYVGCATVKSPLGDMVGICRYAPAGNVQGQWAYGPLSKPAPAMSVLQSRVQTYWSAPRWQSGVAPLTWDDELAAQAQAAVAGRLDNPSAAVPYGELASTTGFSGTPTPPAPSPRSMIVGWINGGLRGAIVDAKFTRVGCATGTKVFGSENRRALVCRVAGPK